METTDELKTVTEIAAELSVRRATVHDICNCYGLKAKRVPRCGPGKGYDASDIDVIRKALGLKREPALAASA